MTRQFAVDIGWRTLLRDLQVRGAHVLRRAALPENLFTRSERELTTDEYFRFWHSLEAEVTDPLLPLRVMQTVTTELFSPPLFAALCRSNLLQASRRLATHKALVAPMTLSVEVGPAGELTLAPRWLEAVGAVPFTVLVTELAFFVRLATIATREDVRAVNVTLSARPEQNEMQAYAEFFGVRVSRGEISSVTFGAADAHRPFLTVNDAMWQVFEPDLRRRLGDLDGQVSTGERVRAALLELLPGGDATIDAVAGRLHLSRRTLQRRLDTEDLSFPVLVNQTRTRLARHYLTNSRLSGGEISFLLGFDDPNSFFRAFKDWTGQTPETVRHQQRLD